MTKQELAERMRGEEAWVPGKRILIDFGAAQGPLMIDGVGCEVSEIGGPSDTVIRIDWKDWEALADGRLDGMSAFMTGKLKVEGDIGNAMQLQSVLAKLRS